MSRFTTHVLIIEDEIAIADTLIYACKEANIATTHYLLGNQALVAIQKDHAEKDSFEKDSFEKDSFEKDNFEKSNFEKNDFDCVLLDIGLPDMTGFDVCKQIRAISNIPIIFLTARNHEIDRIVGLEIGADDYVTKPFSPREVVARIKAILRRTESNPSQASKKSSPFLVDDIASRIQYRNQYLNLTRYEFLLLKTLIKQPNRVFSRNQLMDLVWVNAEDTLERTVDAHIKTLRAKLRQVDSKTEAIVTHRGMGYSLSA